ncbi:MAG: response regulator transcription factor [Chthoniobacterales bacterium]
MPPRKSSVPKDAPHRLLIVDDHPVFRRGIAGLISDEDDFEVAAEASDSVTALSAMRQHVPDLALVDISLPGSNGIELIKNMLAEQPKLIVLMLSMHDESLYALRALRAGAKGYVMKAEAMTSVLTALRKVAGGDIYVSDKMAEQLIFKAVQSDASGVGSPVDVLSDRELEVLELLGRGFPSRDIAERLHLSVKTIETHRAHIKEKMNFKDASEMIRFAVEWTAHEKANG